MGRGGDREGQDVEMRRESTGPAALTTRHGPPTSAGCLQAQLSSFGRPSFLLLDPC